MQYQEISLRELIHYLEGSASESVRKQIDHEREHNPDFAEEYEGWEAFLAESDSREAGIEKMKSFSEEWSETQVDTSVIEPEAKVLQFDSPENIQQTVQRSKPLWTRLAIAACVLLLAGAIISNLMKQEGSSMDFVNQGFAQEMSDRLSVKAGAALENMESFDLQISKMLKSKAYDQVDNKLDSLLSVHPGQSKYMLLQALNLSLSEKNDQAITLLTQILQQPDNTAEFSCKVTFYLASVYAKSGNKEAFLKTQKLLVSDNDQDYVCTELDAKIQPGLEALAAALQK